MNIPYVMKKCGKCGRWLVASTANFHRAKKGKYGLTNKCKECTKKYNKRHHEANKDKRQQWYQANRDEILERSKQYREANREKILERNKKWNRCNKEKVAEYHKQWYKDNREKDLERQKRWKQTPQGQAATFNAANKRRSKEQGQGTGITKDQWLEMMSFFNWKCAYSGETLSKDNRSVDHIVPLNSGGDNMIWNCVPMLRTLNSSKHNKDMLEWYRQQNFYDPNRLAKIYEWQKYARKKWKIS